MCKIFVRLPTFYELFLIPNWGMYLYVGYINEATNFAESQGGGGSDTKDWGREKDEDEIEWIRRCLRQATKMMKPMKRKGLS